MAKKIVEEVAEDPSENYLSPPRKIKNCKHFAQLTAVKFKNLKGISSRDQTGAFPHM